MNNIIWSILLLLCTGCSSKYIKVFRIELNMPKESIFGLPLKSETRYIYPCFEKGVFIDTLENNGQIKIIEENDGYSFYYSNNNDTIKGQLRKLPFEIVEYIVNYNYDSYIEEELKLFKVIGLIRVGEWEYMLKGVATNVKYKTEIRKQEKNFYCN